jgi:hypothetical protein
VKVPVDDGVVFDPNDVRATVATHDDDGYDGIAVRVGAYLAKQRIDVRIDVGFGDVVMPPAEPTSLEPFLEGDDAARVFAYDAAGVVAEKVETLLSKFPVVAHRLKDILDVVMMAEVLAFEGDTLTRSLRATLERRSTPPDVRVLDEMPIALSGKRWATHWATMRKEKRVRSQQELAGAISNFDAFVRPLLIAIGTNDSMSTTWPPGGPWQV